MVQEDELDSIVAALPFQIHMNPEAEQRVFQSFSDLKAFFVAEMNFWQGVQIEEQRTTFRNIVNALQQAEQSGSADSARSNINQARGMAVDTGVIYSSTAHAKFLKELASKGVERARAAFAFLRGNYSNVGPYGMGNFTERGAFAGLMAALFFSNPELISGRFKAEIQAAAEQRAVVTRFTEQIDLNVRALKKDIEDWRSSTRTEVSDFLKQNQEDFKREHENHSSTFQKSAKEWEQKVSDLETLYREKLRLEEPAIYWSNLEKRYITQGRWWIAGAVLIVLTLARWVSVLVYQPPAVLVSDKFTLGGFKGTILIATALSAFLYLMNLFVKVATSSYHLARDARERYQLTHVFLALIKDNAIEAKDREVILSALFSRSDTGLLKGDSGPTPPTTSVIENIFKR